MEVTKTTEEAILGLARARAALAEAMEVMVGDIPARLLPRPPEELLDRAFKKQEHVGPPWCGTVYCPVCLHETFNDLDDHPDADRPPGTSGSRGEA